MAVYQETQNISQTAKICQCNEDSVSRILHSKNIHLKTSMEVNKDTYSTIINQYSMDQNYITSYTSIKDAARAMRPNTTSLGGVTSHISDVCKGKRKSAYGFIWRYANEI